MNDPQYIARISHGKDSLKMLNVIVTRGLPLDRITTTDVWATDTIRAELPEVVESKARIDEYIWRKYRIEVEHLCARNPDGTKRTYEQMFYHVPVRRSQSVQVERERERERRGRPGTILGFPDLWNPWCQAGLKRNARDPKTRNYQGVSGSVQSQVVPETQACARYGTKGSPLKSLPGAGSSKSTRSGPLFRQPATTGKKKYRGIFRNRRRRTETLRSAQRKETRSAGGVWHRGGSLRPALPVRRGAPAKL